MRSPSSVLLVERQHSDMRHSKFQMGDSPRSGNVSCEDCQSPGNFTLYCIGTGLYLHVSFGLMLWPFINVTLPCLKYGGLFVAPANGTNRSVGGAMGVGVKFSGRVKLNPKHCMEFRFLGSTGQSISFTAQAQSFAFGSQSRLSALQPQVLLFVSYEQ